MRFFKIICFIDIIKSSSTSVFNAFKELKNLAESTDITVKKISNTALTTHTSAKKSTYDANFTSKEDIQFMANELAKTKINVNIPQIKFYTSKLMNKLASKKYTSDKYLHVSNVLNEMNNTLVNLANDLVKYVALISSVFVLVIDWIKTGFPPPITRFPI